jgi:NAD+ kinase
MATSSFQAVGVFANQTSSLIQESLQRVVTFLESRGVSIFVEKAAATGIDLHVPTATRAEILRQVELVIAIGGDGSMLGAARDIAPHGLPLLGVNRGRLGFLADVSPEEIETQLARVLDGQGEVEERFLLEGVVSSGGAEPATALNEITVHSAAMPSMIEFELFINGGFVYHQASDGLIVSSPTGSTAYALSAGGPIMPPTLDAIALVPMFPHSLNSRPLVVPGDAELKIALAEKAGTEAKVSFDSQLEFRLQPGESVLVKKAAHRLKLLHPPGQSFYGVCRSKLGWASQKNG